MPGPDRQLVSTLANRVGKLKVGTSRAVGEIKNGVTLGGTGLMVSVGAKNGARMPRVLGVRVTGA
jgi:hypothetical protein